ncbi:hypothetical protein Ae201684P_005267 [Aphanomyces euteiches]|nr:hypothetical protein Ae201684P_005267 [Aphanomyces euteiches]
MEISSSHANLVHFGVQRNFDAQIEERRHVLDDLTDREKMTTFLGYRPFLGLFGKSLEQTRREPAQRRWVCKGSIKRSEAMYIVANRTAGVTTALLSRCQDNGLCVDNVDGEKLFSVQGSHCDATWNVKRHRVVTGEAAYSYADQIGTTWRSINSFVRFRRPVIPSGVIVRVILRCLSLKSALSPAEPIPTVH